MPSQPRPATPSNDALWSRLARRRPIVAAVSALVAVALLGGSWALTTHLRDQAHAASDKVVAVNRATAQLSKLQNEENLFFTGVAAYGFNFTSDLAHVVVTVNAIADPAAAPLLTTYVKASGDVVNLINHSDPLGAAREEVNVQSPASYALVAELSRYAAAQSKDSQSTSNRAGTLTEAVDLGTLLLLVLILLFFWFLDSRSDAERRGEVERAEARFRGIVARGSDAVWLVDPAGAVIFASESTESVLGFDVDEAARPAFADLFPTDERDALTRSLAEVFEDPSRSASAAVAVTEPEKRFLEVVLTNKCEDESIGAVVVSIRDLTERHRAETALERSEALVQDLIDHTPVSVYVKDLDGRYLRVNKAWTQHLGHSAAEAIGASAGELFAGPDGDTIASADAAALVRGPYESETRLTIDGRERTFLVSRFPLLDESGQPYAVGGVSLDITDRVRVEDVERTLGAMVTGLGDAIFTVTNGEIGFWNDAATSLLGHASSDVLGAPPSLLAPESFEEDHARLWAAVASGVTVQAVETMFRRKDGTLVDVEVTLTPQRDVDGAVIGVSAIVRDVTERRRRTEELSRQARTDILTGLPNRAALMSHLARIVGRSAFDGTIAALLFFDLDHFKDVNDTPGLLHAAGDELLRVTADRVRGVLRPADFVARLGGDEFVAVCFPVGGEAETTEIARRVAAAVAEPVSYGDATLHTTASVGVALTPVPNGPTWLGRGDAAMYQAKRSGRNRIVVFEEGMAMEVPDRSSYPREPGEAGDGPQSL